MKLSGIDLGTTLHILAKVSFRSGNYGCSFVSRCGLVTWNANKLPSSMKFGISIICIIFVLLMRLVSIIPTCYIKQTKHVYYCSILQL